MLVIDGQKAFVGGAGIADMFDPPADPDSGWRETMVQIEGPVLQDWCAVFDGAWRKVAGGAAGVRPPCSRAFIEGVPGRVTLAEGLRIQEIARSTIKQIRGAKHRVWIATAYFIPSRKLRRSLHRAARQGVDVRLLLPGPRTDHPAVRYASRRFYGRLLRNGVRIIEYQPRFSHQKVALCDGWVSLGSSNLDRWSLRWNLEGNQEIDDPDFADVTRMMFEEDFSHGLEYTYADWLRRPWTVRLWERFWGTLDLWLSRLSRGIRE